MIVDWGKEGKDEELRMEVKEEHKALLKSLGLDDKDFEAAPLFRVSGQKKGYNDAVAKA